MDKGTRVTIVKGSAGRDQSGVIFWKGKNKWGDGERLGVRSDGGDTFWVSDADVVEAGAGGAGGTAEAPVDAGPSFNKGDRVSFTVRGREGSGAVFWIGENKHGPGQRLGVRDDAPDGDDDAVWLDSRQAKPLEGGAPVPEQPHQQRTAVAYRRDLDDDDDDGIPPAASYDMPPADDGPPLDDAYDNMAASADEDQEPPQGW